MINKHISSQWTCIQDNKLHWATHSHALEWNSKDTRQKNTHALCSRLHTPTAFSPFVQLWTIQAFHQYVNITVKFLTTVYFPLDLYSLMFGNHASPPFLLSLYKIPILHVCTSNICFGNNILSTHECRNPNKASNTYLNCSSYNSSACHFLPTLPIWQGMHTQKRQQAHTGYS